MERGLKGRALPAPFLLLFQNFDRADYGCINFKLEKGGIIISTRYNEKRMDVILIEPKSPGFNVFSGILLPRLGLPILGSILKSLGHKVKIFCEEIKSIDWEEVKKADLVGVSTITSTAPRAYEIASRAKSLGKTVILGGPHVTFQFAEALNYGDFVVRSEGEETLPELIEAIEGRKALEKIKGISYKIKERIFSTPDRPLISDLDKLPFPDLSLIEGGERIKVAPVLTSRGCPFNCSFCSVTRMFGRSYRVRTVQSIMEELKKIKQKAVFFYDDNFTQNRKRLYELCQAILESGKKIIWSAQTRIDIANDFNLLKLMRKSGCSLFHIGFESVDPETLKIYQKKVNPSKYEKSIRTIRKAGIDIHGMFVLGSDADTPGTIRKTVQFAKKNKLFSAQFLCLTPLPGTPFFDQLKREGRIFTENWELYDGHHVVYQPARMTIWELQRESIKAFLQFYSRKELLKNIAFFRWVRAYYLGAARKKIKGWLKQNRAFISSLKSRVRPPHPI